jgi:hypothetical protein
LFCLLKRLRKEAETFKSKGNEQFKAGNYQESAQSYTLALRTCPLAFDKDRAVMYSNRAAAKVKLVSVLYHQADSSVSATLGFRCVCVWLGGVKVCSSDCESREVRGLQTLTLSCVALSHQPG